MKKISVFLFLLVFTTIVKAIDISDKYTWKPLKIGAGGFITGIDVNATDNKVILMRTDVGGAYKLNNAGNEWVLLTTADKMPDGIGVYNDDARGVTSIVSAPTAVNVFYMAYRNRILKSINSGTTWTICGENSWTMHPNGNARQMGERLAVDPKNANVVYYGSEDQGLWVTVNGGNTWEKVSSIPIGTHSSFYVGDAEYGVTTVCFDTTSGVTNGKTNVIYVTPCQAGIWKSSNAGANWTKITVNTEGQDDNTRLPAADTRVISDATVGADGTYYAVESKWAFFKYKNDTWTNIRPGGKEILFVACNPNNSQHIMLFSPSGKCIESTNGGTSWSAEKSPIRIATDVPWLAWTDEGWFSNAGGAIDNSGKLWIAEGVGVWNSTDYSGDNVQWNSINKGIEEMVVNDVVCPPSGKPLSAVWDRTGFYHSNLDEYPAKHMPFENGHGNKFGAGWSFSYQTDNPLNVVGLFTNFQNGENYSSYSADGGASWTQFASQPDMSVANYGNIAVANNDANKIVWMPTRGRMVQYSTNKGATWQVSTLTKSGNNVTSGGFGDGGQDFWVGKHTLVADPNNNNTFLLYHWSEGVFKSTDGGATFIHVSNNLPVNRWHPYLIAIPGKVGHFWFAGGREGGQGGAIYRTTDGGTIWTVVSTVSGAEVIGYGKAAEGADYPALYIEGQVNGVRGIYSSVNEGANWDLISVTPAENYDLITCIDGDKDVFGRVYLGFSGTSLMYGDYNASQTVAVKGIHISKTALSLYPNQTETLLASIVPSNASNKLYSFTSGNSSVAEVSNAGVVKTIAIGTSKVYVTSTDGSFVDSCEVTVVEKTVNPDDIIMSDLECIVPEINPNTATTTKVFTPGGTASIISNPFKNKDNGSNTVLKFVRNSGDWQIMGIELLNAQAANKFKAFEFDYYGTSVKNIYVKITDGASGTWEKTYTSVTSGSWAKQTVDFAADNVNLDNVKVFIISVNATGGSGSEIYYFDNFGLRSTNQALDYGISCAPCTATALAILPDNAQIIAGETVQLSASFTPACASNTVISKWESDNEAFAMVDATGLVTALKAGTAKITATSENDLTATIDVVVSPKPSGSVIADFDIVVPSVNTIVSGQNQFYGDVAIVVNPAKSTINNSNNVGSMTVTDGAWNGGGFKLNTPLDINEYASFNFMVYGTTIDQINIVAKNGADVWSEQKSLGKNEWQKVSITIPAGSSRIINELYISPNSANPHVQTIYLDSVYFATKTNTLITNNTIEHISIYPNPINNGMLTISGLQENTTVIITDISGRIIFERLVSDSIIQVPYQQLNPGMLFISLTNKQCSQTSKLIVK